MTMSDGQTYALSRWGGAGAWNEPSSSSPPWSPLREAADMGIDRPREDCFADSLVDESPPARLARSASESRGAAEAADATSGGARKAPRAWEAALAAEASEAASNSHTS